MNHSGVVNGLYIYIMYLYKSIYIYFGLLLAASLYGGVKMNHSGLVNGLFISIYIYRYKDI